MFARKMSHRPIIISIEGDIGSGKSTLLRELHEKYPELHFIDEPLSTWTSFKNEEGESLLTVFYKDIRRWAYTFQNCAILSRAQNIFRAIQEWEKECIRNPDAAHNNIFITERCLLTDKHVFAQMLRDDGKMDGIEWDLYNRWYDEMLKSSVNIDALVYVDTSPEVCLQRIKHRGRDGEQEIPLDYLKNLDKYHKSWLNTTTTEKVMKYNNSRDDIPINTPEDVMAFIKSL